MLAPTLAGHAGGPPVSDLHPGTLADGVERAMDEAGFETAHVAGNSLGGNVALQLAARGRARSVVALAPAGGWADGDESWRDALQYFRACPTQVRAAAPYAAAIMPPRRAARGDEFIAERWEHIPAELLAHQLARRRRLRRRRRDDRAGRARGAGRSTRSASTARSGWCGAPPTASSRGRPPPPATAAR